MDGSWKFRHGFHIPINTVGGKNRNKTHKEQLSTPIVPPRSGRVHCILLVKYGPIPPLDVPPYIKDGQIMSSNHLLNGIVEMAEDDLDQPWEKMA